MHLSAITRILRETLPETLPSQPYTIKDGPFAGLSVPHKSADANAGYITSSLIEAYLITHPHLDHISGFVVNTAGPTGTRPKKLAGLPNTIHAFKTHIFNNVIWPNLSDENNGAGLITYCRLVEGGSPALGDGYSEICDGLLVKIWSVSHGHCIEKHCHRGSQSSASGHDLSALQTPGPRRGGGDSNNVHASQTTPRRQSLLSQATFGSTGGGGGSGSPGGSEAEKFCVYDSSAYFIQDCEHKREVLIFGDVEPDSLSLSPRNLQIWQEAASKFVAGSLAAIFIECSYDDSRSNDRLFGHLKPTYVIEELKVLAAEVMAASKTKSEPGPDATKKRKRMSDASAMPRSAPRPPASEEPVSPKTTKTVDVEPASTGSSRTAGRRTRASASPHISTPTHDLTLREDSPPLFAGERRQLEGLKVVIIHVKESLTDDDDVGETILKELQEHEKSAQLGCEFVIAHSGQSFYL